MNIPRLIAAGAFSTLLATSALAAVSPEEANKLGGELTLFGAIKAGNADGSIPEYTGGLDKPVPGFVPKSGHYVDPFETEEPLFRVTSANMNEHADKLSDGVKHLLKNNSEYYLDIYPSHRTAAYPQEVLEATVRNATACNTIEEELGVDKVCRGGIPFPIPQTGYEVMWNKLLAFTGTGAWIGQNVRSFMVSSKGTPVLTASIGSYTEKPYYQVDRSDRPDNMTLRLYSVTEAPSRKAGEMTGYADFLNPVADSRKAWSYAPGQRRIKLAPEFSYDTPVSTTGGVMLYDEIFLFTGLMDRFDFKLVGQKEMYIPYNNYAISKCSVGQWAMPNHVNPECERWELHRVWVVESTLKPDMRHVYQKRTYYIDEDSYNAGLMDGWDHSGALYRTGIGYSYAAYEVPAINPPTFTIYDFNRGMYSRQSDFSEGKYYYDEARPERSLNPEAIAGGGIR